MRLFRVLAVAGAGCGAFACIATMAETPGDSNLADQPKFYKRDPQATVIADIATWSHPTKDVFNKYHLKLTKVELMWNKTFPVFHVTDFGADPGARPSGPYFTSLEMDLLKANGYNAFKIVEDNVHDGFVVAYDRPKRFLDRELVQGEDP